MTRGMWICNRVLEAFNLPIAVTSMLSASRQHRRPLRCSGAFWKMYLVETKAITRLVYLAV